MKAVLGGLVAAIAFAALPARADCPPDAVQTAFTAMQSAPKTATSDVAALGDRLDRLAADCPANPYVLKAAATGWAALAGQDPNVAIDRFVRSRQLFRQMWANLKSGGAVTVTDASGGSKLFGFDDLHEIESRVRDLLFTAEQKAGRLAPEDMPPGQGEPLRACSQHETGDAQRAYFWVLNKGDHAGAFNVLDRTVAACESDFAKGSHLGALGQRASALTASAQRNLKAPSALEKLKRARVDGDRFHALNKGWDKVVWTREASARLDDLILQVLVGRGEAPPRTDWFTSDYVSTPTMEKLVALAIDAAWAANVKAGGMTLGHKTYRDELTSLWSQSLKASDMPAARTMIYTAAKAQAEGRTRAPENASLPAPPQYLYSWMDPAKTPPAP